jgi:hypothetical protein
MSLIVLMLNDFLNVVYYLQTGEFGAATSNINVQIGIISIQIFSDMVFVNICGFIVTTYGFYTDSRGISTVSSIWDYF